MSKKALRTCIADINRDKQTKIILTTKEALTYLINRYNPDNIYIEKEKIEDIIQRIFTN
jgi:hypothetical protein